MFNSIITFKELSSLTTLLSLKCTYSGCGIKRFNNTGSDLFFEFCVTNEISASLIKLISLDNRFVPSAALVINTVITSICVRSEWLKFILIIYYI